VTARPLGVSAHYCTPVRDTALTAILRPIIIVPVYPFIPKYAYSHSESGGSTGRVVDCQ